MATSFVDLSNQALSRLGQANITSLTDGSTEANACNSFYQSVLGALLANPVCSQYPNYSWQWPRRVASGVSGESTNPRWGFEYVVPSDCVGVCEIIDPKIPQKSWHPQERLFRNVIPFQEGAGGTNAEEPVPVLWCNLPAISVFYISDAIPVQNWPAAFSRAYYLSLAAEIAPMLSASPALISAVSQAADQAIGAACQADQRVQVMSTDYVPDWIEARGFFPGRFDERAIQSTESYPSGFIVGLSDASSPVPYHLNPAQSLNGVPSMGIPDDSARNRLNQYVPAYVPDSRIGILTIGVSPIGWRRPFHNSITMGPGDGAGEAEQ